MLDIPEKYTPAQKAGELFGKKSLRQRTTEALKDQRGSLSTGDTTQSRLGNQVGSSVDTNTLSPRGLEAVNKFLRHMDGEEVLSQSELRDVLSDVQTIADTANLAPKGNESNATLASRLADKYALQIRQLFNQ